jgi:hypothetical protein
MDIAAGLDVNAISIWIAFALTLMVFSYVLGDNPLFRIAEHLFVGAAAGYAVVMAYHSVLRPRLLAPLIEAPELEWYRLIPLLLGLLLLSKGRSSTAWLGNSTMGFLFGTGAALALGGALLGSIGPQIEATWVSLNPSHAPDGWAGVFDGMLIVLGTSGALMHFYYTAPTVAGLSSVWARVRQGWGRVGYWFILMALGAIFANTIIARFSLLVGRVRFLLDTIGLLGS